MSIVNQSLVGYCFVRWLSKSRCISTALYGIGLLLDQFSVYLTLAVRFTIIYLRIYKEPVKCHPNRSIGRTDGWMEGKTQLTFAPQWGYCYMYLPTCLPAYLYLHRKPSLVKQLSPKTSFALSLLTVLRARTFALSRKRADDPIVRYLSVGTSI